MPEGTLGLGFLPGPSDHFWRLFRQQRDRGLSVAESMAQRRGSNSYSRTSPVPIERWTLTDARASLFVAAKQDARCFATKVDFTCQSNLGAVSALHRLLLELRLDGFEPAEFSFSAKPPATFTKASMSHVVVSLFSREEVEMVEAH